MTTLELQAKIEKTIQLWKSTGTLDRNMIIAGVATAEQVSPGEVEPIDLKLYPGTAAPIATLTVQAQAEPVQDTVPNPVAAEPQQELVGSRDIIGYIEHLFDENDTLNFTFLKQGVVSELWMTREEALDPNQNLVETIGAKQKDGWNAYVAMNAYGNPELGRKKTNVAAVRNVYLDFDENGEHGIAEIKKDAANGLLPSPHFILQSSPGKFYAVWNVDGFTVEQQERLNKALQLRYHADKAATDAARVLRIAGSVNLKYPDKPVVEIIEQKPGDLFTPADFKLEVSNTDEEPKDTGHNQRSLIPHGHIHPWMVSQAGGLRNKGLTPEEIEPILIRLVHENCEPPIDDNKVKQVARSMANYPAIVPQPVIVGGKVPGQPPNSETPSENWLKQFRSVDEMEDGPIVMVINGVLQEGICFIGANPGDGKTWVALAFAKAISTGTPLFDLPQYDVSVARTVIYLIPESRDRAFRKRCEAFEMPKDKMKFMTRTISAGAPLQLSDPNLLEAVHQTKAVVFLDTAARFMRGTDENAAAQNRLLVNDVVALLEAGATTIVLVHHATKEAKQKKMAMTLENMLRGSSDLGAMCDQAYGIRKDMGLYANGSGPMEIDLVDLKDREDVGMLTSIRLAASYKKPGSIFPVSYFYEKHNFQVVDDTEAFKRKVDSLVAMIMVDPNLPEKEIAERSGLSTYTVKHYLNGRGYHRVQGGPDGASPWHQDKDEPCPYKNSKKGKGKKADVDFGDHPVGGTMAVN